MSEPQHSYAVFMATTDENGRDIPANQREKIKVHFNPETLDITFTNTVQKGRGRQPAQVVNDATAKLSMELIFDTTLNGVDVRVETHKIARMMDPAQHTPRRRNGDSDKVPAIVVFQWGTIVFEGYIDSYKERIEFFSPEGVPLRAIVTLSLTQQERSFTPTQRNNNQSGGGSNNDLNLHNNAPVKRLSQNENLTHTARKLGNSGAARDLAKQNGVENMRHPEVDEIVVANHLGRSAPNLVASAGAGLNVSAALALDETESQFANLRSQFSASANLTPRVNLSLAAGGDLGQSLSLRGKAGFGLGGEVGAEVNASLSADVGVDADIELGIQFED